MIRLNEADWDRALRVLIGGGLLLLSYLGVLTAWTAVAAMLGALFLLLTGLIGWCPLYSLFGALTRQLPPRGAEHS